MLNSCKPNPIPTPKNKNMINFLSSNISLKNLMINADKKIIKKPKEDKNNSS